MLTLDNYFSIIKYDGDIASLVAICAFCCKIVANVSQIFGDFWLSVLINFNRKRKACNKQKE